MVAKQSLVVVSFVERIPGDFYRLCEVAECQVEHVNLFVPGLVVKHNVKLFLLVCLVLLLFTAECWLVKLCLVSDQLFFFLLMSFYNVLDFLEQLNNRLRNSLANFEQEVRYKYHHNQGKECKRYNKDINNVIANISVYLKYFLRDDCFRDNKHK